MPANVFAQGIVGRAVSCSAGALSNQDNFHVAITIGEPITGTYYGGSMIITQGFQQPEDRRVVPVLETVAPKLRVFPTLVSDHIYAQLNGGVEPSYRYVIYNILGEAQGRGTLSNGEQVSIPVSHLSPGYYLFAVDNGGQFKRSPNADAAPDRPQPFIVSRP